MNRIIANILLVMMLGGAMSGCQEEDFSGALKSTAQSAVSSVTEPATGALSDAVGGVQAVFTKNGEVDIDALGIPEYSGQAYVFVNGNQPFFTDEEKQTQPFEEYAPLDWKGRCGAAYACLDGSQMPEGERGDISSVYPTGWEQSQYSFVDQGWLYNRCHLIAWSLAGEDANERNLITGTRYLNIEGMWQIEETALWYLRENPGKRLLYRVTPHFKGANLLCSGVLMEGYSIDDGGSGAQFCVYCYNVQPGVGIDYATGENWQE